MELFAHVVNALALEEDHRVGALQCGIHQPLRIIGRNGEHDLQARDMCRQRSPVLRVLRTVFRTDRHAYDHGHLEDVAAHRLPFGQLVEYLVAAAAEEVAIHNFGDHASAAHCVSDCGADDGRLGDRRIEQAVVG